MADYATVSDIQTLKRTLSLEEQTRAAALIPLISSLIRWEAQKTGRDFDQMIYESELVPVIDSFAGDDETTTFTLSAMPQMVELVTVNGSELSSDDYSVSGNEITLTDVLTSSDELLVMYSYRALADVVKGVVCDVVMRELNTPGNQLPATSYSESAGSVSQSYSLPNSSGSIKLWPSDLKALGLKRQQISSISLMKPRRR